MELSSDGDEGGDDDESGSHPPPPPPQQQQQQQQQLIPPPLLLLLSEEDIDHLLDTLLSSSFMEELRFLRDAQQAFEMAERHIGTVFPTMATMHRTTLARRMLDLGTVPRRNTMRSWLVDYFFDEERMIDEELETVLHALVQAFHSGVRPDSFTDGQHLNDRSYQHVDATEANVGHDSAGTANDGIVWDSFTATEVAYQPLEGTATFEGVGESQSMDDNYFLFSIPAEPSTRNDDPVIGAENRIVDASLHRRNDDTENFDDIERYLETILHDDDGPLEIEDGSPSTKYSPERDDDNNDIIIVPIPPFNNGIDESRDPTAFSGDVEDSWPNNSPDPLVLAKPVHLYCPLVAVEDASTSIEESKNNENTRHDASPRNHQSHQRPTYADGNRKITACTFCGYEKVTKNKSTSDDVPHVCPNEIDDNDEVRVKHLLFKAFPGFREIDTYLPHDKLSASSGASDGEDIEKMIDEALEEQETNGRQDQEEREKDRATLLESLVPSKRAITTNEFAGRPDEEYSSGVSQSQGKRKRVRKGKDQHDGDDDVSDVSDRTDNNSDESYDDESYDDDEDETDKNKNKDHSSDEA